MNEWAPGIFALAGVALGGVGNWLLSRWQREQDRTAKRNSAERDLLVALLEAMNEGVHGCFLVLNARDADSRTEAESVAGPALRRQFVLTQQIRDDEIVALSNALYEKAITAQLAPPRGDPRQAEPPWNHFVDDVGNAFGGAARKIGRRLQMLDPA